MSADTKQPPYHWAGGTCGNVLTILAYLGWSAFPIARLNAETSSLRVKNDMRNWGVRLDFVRLAPTTGVSVITQEISIKDDGTPSHKFHWRNCPKCGSWLPNYKPVTLRGTKVVKEKTKKGDLYFFDRTSPGALDLARHFKSLGALIFFEPSAKGDPRHFEEALKLADIVKYSDQRFASVLKKGTGIAPFLELQTLGSRGLRYRFAGKRSWSQLNAFEVDGIYDTCGSGDWTTAGIISQLCRGGLDGLFASSEEDVISALTYGQALGAWNCGFEGARGGMYQVDKRRFKKDISEILNGDSKFGRRSPNKSIAEHTTSGYCPACPN